MALSAFDDKAHPPSPADLDAMLGRAAALWRRLVDEVQLAHGPLEELWNFAGPKFGWSLRLKDRKRVVVYLTPVQGHFLVGLVLGERAVAAAQASDLAPAVLRQIDEARRYAEGRGVRLAVRTGAELADVLRLVKLRMSSL